MRWALMDVVTLCEQIVRGKEKNRVTKRKSLQVLM